MEMKFEVEFLPVVATHGLIKKTAQTPKTDLEKAERLRKQYFNL